MSEWTNDPERWSVEVSDGVFEPVGPSVLTITDGGALVFRPAKNGPIMVAYAPGAWRTVSADGERARTVNA